LKSIAIILLLLGIFHSYSHAQSVSQLNLDFSQRGINTKLPQNWLIDGAPYDFVLDSVGDNQTFSKSVSIQAKPGAGLSTIGDISSYVIAYPLRGHKITFSGIIRTDSVTNGYATLYIYDYASDSSVGKQINYDGRASGTQNFTKVSVTMDVDQNSDYIIIGGMLRGNGKAWFGGFTLECDGKPLNETETYVIDPKIIDWMNQKEIPLADRISDTMYKSLNLDYFNPYRYIALGENTHGSSEEFIAKGEMVKSLILHNRVQVIAFEKGVAEGDLIDKSLQNNGLGLKEVWGKYSSSPWDNSEILNFLKWVADYNSKASANEKVHFVGIDIQKDELATTRLVNYATATSNKILLSKLLRLRKLQKESHDYMFSQGFRYLKKSMAKEYIQASKEVLDKTIGITDSNWVSEYGTMLNQSAIYWSFSDYMSSWQYRDMCMATNLAETSRKFNSGKAVIWAHNGHIANKKNAMGSFLRARFGDSMAIVGVTTDEGSFNTIMRYTYENKIKEQAVRFTPTNIQSYEYILSKSKKQNFILPLKEININDSTKWLNQVRLFRETTTVTDAQFQPYNLGKAFDYVVFIKRTSPSNDFEIH